MTRRKAIAKCRETGATLSANSVTEMAEILGTSRTNLSDVINQRTHRKTFTAKNKVWVVS